MACLRWMMWLCLLSVLGPGCMAARESHAPRHAGLATAQDVPVYAEQTGAQPQRARVTQASYNCAPG